MNKGMHGRYIAESVLPLLWVLLLLLAIGSWMAQAAGATVNSLLSPEGLRWLFGNSMNLLFNGGTGMLWLVLTAFGAVRYSGLDQFVFAWIRPRSGHPVSLRQRHACYLALLVWLLYAAVLVGLLLGPQTILLSATGRLAPSPFMSGLLPAVVLGFVLLSLTYGLVSRRLRMLADVGRLITCGTVRYAAWLCLYITVSLLAAALQYVLS